MSPISPPKKIRSDIPVIICSGYSDESLIERATQTGISAFLMKPLVIQDLATTIREVLGKTDPGCLSTANH